MTPNIEIRIEGYLMEVDEKVGAIATTYQVFDFKNIGSVKANYTGRLTLPITNTNIQRLEMIAPLSVITTKPYRNLSIQVVQDGQEVITNGTCQIVSIQDRISLDIQSGVKGFWDALEGKYLNDIDLSAYNGERTGAILDSLRNTTSGLVNPLVKNSNVGVQYSGGHLTSDTLIPFFYYHTIITQIFALVGYSKAGTIFSDTNRYTKLVLSTRLVYNDVYMDTFKCGAKVASYVVPNGSVNIRPNFDSAYVNSSFINLTNAFSLNVSASQKFVSINVKYSGFCTGIVTVHLRVFSVGTNIFSDVLTASGAFSFSHNITLGTGTTTDFAIAFSNSSGSSQTVTNLKIDAIPNNTTDTTCIQTTAGVGWYWYYKELLPRITLKSFIKDFMKMFGLVMIEKNKTVTFKTIKEILNDIAPSTVELSREDKTKKPLVNYDLDGFAQTNNFYWIVQDDELVINDFYGKGKFLLDNTTLPASQDIYTSIFTASDMVPPADGSYIALPNIMINNSGGASGSYTKAASFGFRLLLLRDDEGIPCQFDGATNRTDYFIGYFIDKNQTYSLDWQELVNEYYSEYADVLNRWTTVQQDYFISLVEAAKMDLTKPVTKDGITYIIEKVENYIPGKFAKFNLIKR